MKSALARFASGPPEQHRRCVPSVLGGEVPANAKPVDFDGRHLVDHACNGTTDHDDAHEVGPVSHAAPESPASWRWAVLMVAPYELFRATLRDRDRPQLPVQQQAGAYGADPTQFRTDQVFDAQTAQQSRASLAILQHGDRLIARAFAAGVQQELPMTKDLQDFDVFCLMAVEAKQPARAHGGGATGEAGAVAACAATLAALAAGCVVFMDVLECRTAPTPRAGTAQTG